MFEHYPSWISLEQPFINSTLPSWTVFCWGNAINHCSSIEICVVHRIMCTVYSQSVFPIVFSPQNLPQRKRKRRKNTRNRPQIQTDLLSVFFVRIISICARNLLCRNTVLYIWFYKDSCQWPLWSERFSPQIISDRNVNLCPCWRLTLLTIDHTGYYCNVHLAH